ncbi:hypothetical protein TNCV_3844321 [Trichonephila clavipes]|nr:hypothetical protein TNCV_3844321 [Trichonephila clavipes]
MIFFDRRRRFFVLMVVYAAYPTRDRRVAGLSGAATENPPCRELIMLNLSRRLSLGCCCADVNSVMWRRSVKLVPHEAAQRQMNMSCVKKFGQDVDRRSDMPNRPKNWKEGTVQ